MTLEAKSLVMAVVPSSLIPNSSPGNLQSSRLALHVSEDGSSCWAYVASGCHIYKLKIPLEDSFVSKGKESLLIPVQSQVMDSFLVNRCPHCSEIQSIELTETESTGYLMLGSVDSYGHLIVSKLDTAGKGLVPDGKLVVVVDTDWWYHPQVAPAPSNNNTCLDPFQWEHSIGKEVAAVARSFCKTVDVYDQDIHVQTLRTLWFQSALNFMQNLSPANENSILAITEGCQLTIWDLRMKENGGCLHRICGSPGDFFYAVCSSSTGNIAVGGADRTVTVYDPRSVYVSFPNACVVSEQKAECYECSHLAQIENLIWLLNLGFRWAALSRWVHCLKYESFFGCSPIVKIIGMAFSSIDPDHIYIQGVDYEQGRNHFDPFDWIPSSTTDYEVFCGQWKENTKVFSFRGDSNWLGFSKNQANLTTDWFSSLRFMHSAWYFVPSLSRFDLKGSFVASGKKTLRRLSFRGDSNWLGFSKCNKRDFIGGWCDSGSIFVADVVAKESEINTVKGFVNGFS
ncbi:hypothetical protein CJ030_MR0G007484 [Morella rubra]|uniref:Uncharacterized protein n=1 Tax=Morella rubra TaxID=262757 RepID=A0A6A1UIQ4_9ROSI|nr:hypothetical protein CJ030_MR0G007484 [Morella rubra]